MFKKMFCKQKFIIICLAFAIAAVSADVSHLFSGSNVEKSYLPPDHQHEPSNQYLPPVGGAPAPPQYQPAPPQYAPPPPQYAPPPPRKLLHSKQNLII